MQRVLAFDASPLIHFARAGELATLKQLVSEFRCVITDAVSEEIRNGIDQHPELGEVDQLPWLQVVSVKTLDELYIFAGYLRILGSDRRNGGEATVLAWAETHEAVAFIDDQAACNAGRNRGVTVYRTLHLVVRAYPAGLFDEQRVQDLITGLVDSGARFPARARTDLLGWAHEQGLL